MEELKPCPFCGCDGGVEYRAIGVAINCINPNCECAFTDWHKTESLAAKQWNTRADNEVKCQAITELLEQHKKDRAKVSSKCDLINMSTVEKYLRSLG